MLIHRSDVDNPNSNKCTLKSSRSAITSTQCARKHTIKSQNDRQLFGKANTCKTIVLYDVIDVVGFSTA